MNLTVGDQVSNGITMYTILKVNYDERHYHVITNYLTTAKLKFDTVDDRYMYCGHINLDKSLELITDKERFNYKIPTAVLDLLNNKKANMTVLDLLNKTNISSDNLIELFCPSYGFQAMVGGNRTNSLYKKFINTYGNLAVDEVTIRKTDIHTVLSIKVDYYDNWEE